MALSVSGSGLLLPASSSFICKSVQAGWWPQMKCQHAEMQREHRIANYGMAALTKLRLNNSKLLDAECECESECESDPDTDTAWAPEPQSQPQGKRGKSACPRSPLPLPSAKCLPPCVTLSTVHRPPSTLATRSGAERGRLRWISIARRKCDTEICK